MTAPSELRITRQSIFPKICVIESCLHESFVNFKELKCYIEELCDQVEKYKSELSSLQERCESQNCHGSGTLKKAMSEKDNIIQLIASLLTRLNETKNFSIVDEIFTIIFKEHMVSSPEEVPSAEKKSKTKKTPVKKDSKVKSLSPKKEPVPVKKEICNSLEPVCIKKGRSNSLEDVSFKDESVTEIDSTPTRRSPIMFPKKLTSKSITNSPDYRDKKKCPDEWVKPEAKSRKLVCVFPTGKCSGRSRQTKLKVTEFTPPLVVDLATVSQQLGTRRADKSEVQPLIRKESSDNDDTIMPSPTSGPNNFLLTKTIKENIKPKKILSLKNKCENSVITVKTENKDTTPTDIVDMEESINVLNSKLAKPKLVSPENKQVQSPAKTRFDGVVSSLRPVKLEPNSQDTLKFPKPKTPPPAKAPPLVISPDTTACEVDESMSLLRPIVKQEMDHFVPNSEILNYPSPKKRPLCENINTTNVPSDGDICTQASVSILAAAAVNMEPNRHNDDKMAKRKTPEKVEPVYKEATVRKKAEKMALPAWCCHDCEVFFGALYKDDPDRDEKIANVIKNCSKHRGKTNPVRPKTPPNFWNPRWDVPDDTEEFNRRNNAI